MTANFTIREGEIPLTGYLAQFVGEEAARKTAYSAVFLGDNTLLNEVLAKAKQGDGPVTDPTDEPTFNVIKEFRSDDGSGKRVGQVVEVRGGKQDIDKLAIRAGDIARDHLHQGYETFWTAYELTDPETGEIYYQVSMRIGLPNAIGVIHMDKAFMQLPYETRRRLENKKGARHVAVGHTHRNNEGASPEDVDRSIESKVRNFLHTKNGRVDRPYTDKERWLAENWRLVWYDWYQIRIR